MTIFIDLESIPRQPEAEAKAEIAETIKAPAQMKKPETIQEWHEGKGKYIGVKDAAINEAYLKTGLDGTYGEICSISWAVDDGEINVFNRDGSKEGEREFLIDFWFELEVSCAKASLNFVAHNKKFDLPFIWHRSVINSVKPSIRFEPHSREHYCTMEEWAGYNKFIGMDRLAKALGLEGKSGEGCQVWEWWQAGEYEKIAEYNKDDVRLLREIYNRMIFK